MTGFAPSNTAINFIIIGILAYVAFMVIQGLSQFKKTSESVETFYNADRGVNSFMLLCSTIISALSGLTYYGWPSAVYTQGIGYVAGLAAFSTGLIFCVVGYRLWLLGKEYGFTTPTDFLRNRYYSEGFGIFVSILLVAFIIPYVSLQLIAIGDGVSITTNGKIAYMAAVLVGTVTIGVHVFGGGMKSVAWMDTFHMMLGIAALYCVFFFLLKNYFPEGGLAEAAQKVLASPETASILSHPGPKGIFTVTGCINAAMTASIANIVWPHIFTRTYIAKSKKNFLVMAWGFPIGYLIVFFGLVVIGGILAPAILGPGFTPADSIMPILSSRYCPPIIAFLSILCLFAFAVSTSESMLLAATGMLSKDIFIRHRYELKGKEVDQHKVIKLSRYVVMAMAVIILYIVAKKPASITEYAYKLSSPFFAMILPATIGGLYWKRGTKEGAIIGTVAGVVVVTLFTFVITPPAGLSALVWGLIANAGLYVAVSLCTKVPAEIVDKYITRVSNYISAGTDMNVIVGNTILASAFDPKQLSR